MHEKAYTTFQISKICNVTHRTVLSWINQGKIKAFKTPGGHSRVRACDLAVFLKAFHIPLPDDLKTKKCRILIVDDEKDLLLLLENALTTDDALKPHIKVSTCQNGMDALLHMGKQVPHLLILDIYLPGLNGFEVCKRIRHNPDLRDIHIIAISGIHVDETHAKILSAGANDFMPKPFKVKDIQEKVKTVLHAFRHA